jgi:hypothetical protein
MTAKIDFKKTLDAYQAKRGKVGKHHEIYLSDFRRVAPEKQRTILRQPVDT